MVEPLPDAVALGSCDAVEALGLPKSAGVRLLGTALGALAGGTLSERDERAEGAAAGAALGFLGGHGLASVGEAADRRVVQPALGRVGPPLTKAWNRAQAAVGPPVTQALNKARAFVSPLLKKFAGQSALDLADVLDDAGNAGNLLHPALGAGAGAALAHFGIGSNRSTTALGALLGAGSGALYNQFTAPLRQQDALQQLLRERRGFPVRGQAHATANEATPMVVSGASGAL